MRSYLSLLHFTSSRVSYLKRTLITLLMCSLVMGVTLGFLSISEATVARRATVESLSDQANLIVHARITRQWTPKKRGPQGQIYTYTELTPLDIWFGEVKGSLILVQLGGTIDDLHLKIHGDATLSIGQEAVFFLTSQKDHSLPIAQPELVEGMGVPQVAHLVSLAQGVFYLNTPLINGEATLRQDLEGLVFYESQPSPLKLSEITQTPVHSSENAIEPSILSLTTLRAQVKSFKSGAR